MQFSFFRACVNFTLFGKQKHFIYVHTNETLRKCGFACTYDMVRVFPKSFPRGFVQMFPAHSVL